MKNDTRKTLINAGASLLSITIGVITAVGINTMKKDINKSIDDSIQRKLDSEKKRKFWEKKR